MADEPHYHSGGDSAPVKRKYDDSAPRRATGFSDGPPSSNSAPSYNNVPPPMDEIQIAKQRAQEIAARLISSAEAKRPKFENGGSGWDSNDNSGFSSGPNDSVPSDNSVPPPMDEIQIAKQKAKEIAARIAKQKAREIASSPDSVPSDNSVPPSMDEIQIAKQKAKEIAARIAKRNAKEITARIFKASEAKHSELINGGFSAASLFSLPYNNVPPPMDQIQIAKHPNFDDNRTDWVSQDTCDFSSSSTDSKLMSLL